MVHCVRHGGFLVEQVTLEFLGVQDGLFLPLVMSSLKAAVFVLASLNHVRCVLDDVFVDVPFVRE